MSPHVYLSVCLSVSVYSSVSVVMSFVFCKFLLLATIVPTLPA